MNVQGIRYVRMLDAVAGSRLRSPERRFIDLSPKPGTGVRVLDMLHETVIREPFPGADGAVLSFVLFDNYIRTLFPQLSGCNSRECYLTLPRTTRSERLAAEAYRILRVLDLTISNGGKIDYGSNGVSFGVVIGITAYSCYILLQGIDLLTSFVSYYLSLPNRNDPPAYAEAILSSYYSDIVDQIKDFHDEDADILVFKPAIMMTRQLRLVCGNASYRFDEECIVFHELEHLQKNRGILTVDFHVQIGKERFVIPVEALTENKLQRRDLPSWKVQEYRHG